MPDQSKTETTSDDNEKVMEVIVKIVSQGDLRTASYALYLAEESEKDEEKKASLKRVQDALWEITNWTGVEAIASDEIVGNKEYMKGKVA